MTNSKFHTKTNVARVDLVVLSKEIQKLNPRIKIFHSGTTSGYYLVLGQDRATVDMPLEQLLAYCIHYSFVFNSSLTPDT